VRRMRIPFVSFVCALLGSVLVSACVATPPPAANAPADALHDPAATATSPARAPGAPSAVAAPSVRFPVMPMTLVINNVARHEKHVLELRADATLWGDGSAVGKLDGARIVADDGSVLVSVADDGKVLAHGHPTPMRFEGDEVVAEGGAKLSVDEKGQLIFLAPGKDATHMPINVEGYVVAAKRTALLLTVLVAMPSE
jgi:hypothetical protein